VNTFWNNGEKSIIKGLDILGLRSVDQSIETQLVASITTISIRARYLSLIPWLVGELFHRHENEVNLDSGKMRHLLMQAFDRLELVIILSTRFEKTKNTNILDTGMIGTEVYENLVNEFNQTGSINKIVLKEKSNGKDYTNPSYGTYFNPCRGFGLLDHSPTAPVALPPIGIAIYKARSKKVLPNNGVLDWLLLGGELTKAMIENESEHFSIGNISSIPEELALLQEAFLTPYDISNQSVTSSYIKFNHTLLWALEGLEDPKKPQQLIYDNFDQCTSSESSELRDIELFWFEFELRRRVHYALELLLKALSQTIDELNGATVEKSVERWLDDIAFSDVYPQGRDRYEGTLEEMFSFLAEDIYLSKKPIEASEQGIYAISLLEKCRLQSQVLMSKISSPESGIDYMKKTFTILELKSGDKVYEVLIDIIKNCVVEPHLKTTLRKMGQGQQCSLRFFPEGQKLNPTGIDTYAGWSGSRLDNTLRMMSDIGLCEPMKNNNYKKNDMSDIVISRLRRAA
jgi:hypothetical protein